MTDVSELILDRLTDLDRRRARRAKPLYFAYCGTRTPGVLADPPNDANVRVFREGDEHPSAMLHYSWSLMGLRAWFDTAAVKLGPNVWRWKED